MKHIIISALYLITLLSLSVFVFDPTNLYYELPWLDIPMHIMGGVGVTSFVLSIFSYNKKNVSIKHILIIYLCIAVTWELYELMQDFARSTAWNGWYDTITDFVYGGIGAFLGYSLLKK